MKKIHHWVRDEAAIPGGRRVALTLESGRERLPGVLTLPGTAARVPAALLLHGFRLDKDRMADSVGIALMERGIASLAIDLPLHGERFETVDTLSIRTPFELLRRWRAALDECSLALQFLAERPDLDPARISLVGYSLGAFLALKVATREPAVRAVLLAAAGDLPDYTPFAGFVRTIADPLKMVSGLSGRPLLMVHGRWDRTILPAQAERLYEAAREPKELRWWDAGHVLPPSAIADAAVWLAERMGPGGSTMGINNSSRIRF